jgi:hypothetical protein
VCVCVCGVIVPAVPPSFTFLTCLFSRHCDVVFRCAEDDKYAFGTVDLVLLVG